MSILKPRVVYKPFEYPKAYDFWEKQQQAHWLHHEVQMSGDVSDWKGKLADAEKNVIGNVLKGFTQSEVFIEDYWSNKVANWFKKPEIQMMANTFAAFETIHISGYAYLNDTLGLDEYDAFLHEPNTKAKIDRLMQPAGKTKKEIAKSLAIFSAFNEGVNLFSSFAILMSFSRRNLLKGMGQIVAWSIRDESLHSDAGCWLFNEMIEEFPNLWTDDFKKDLYDAARMTVKLEDNFIDKCFELGDIDGISVSELKNYIRFRTNAKLQQIGLKTNWKNIDSKLLEKMDWFNVLASGEELQDFFAGRVTSYSKSQADFSTIDEEL